MPSYTIDFIPPGPDAPPDFEGTDRLIMLDTGMREVPKRTPLDWRDHPLTTDDAHHYVIGEAEYLDAVFRRLYQGSKTFRALIATTPAVARMVTMVNVFEDHAGAINGKFGEIDIHRNSYINDTNGLTSIYILAHEYRHAQQIAEGRGYFGTIMNSSTLGALLRLIEADAYSFASVCLHEVFAHENPRSLPSHMQIPGEDGKQQAMNAAYIHAAESDPQNFDNGIAASCAFEAFLSSENTNTLKIYDQQAAQVILKVAHAFGVELTSKDMTRLRFMNTGTTLSAFKEDASLTSFLKTAFTMSSYQAQFNKLKTMPYMDSSGQIVERPAYLLSCPAQKFLHYKP